MIKVHKEYDEYLSRDIFDASVKIGNIGYISAIGHTEEFAIKKLKDGIEDFIAPLLEIIGKEIVQQTIE